MSNNDVLVLKKLASSNETAERLFTHFALKERNRQPYSVVRSLRNLHSEGEDLNAEQVNKILSELEKGGFGKAVKKKKGRITHFNFNYPAYRIGKAALEGAPLKGPLEEAKAPKAAVAKTLNLNPVAKQVKPAPAALQQVSTTSKTVIYCTGINGRAMKVEVQGELTQAQVDSMLKNFQSQGSA